MPTCCAVVLTGVRQGLPCTKNVYGNATRCGNHVRSFVRNSRDVACREVRAFQSMREGMVEDIVNRAALPIDMFYIYAEDVNAWATDRCFAIRAMPVETLQAMSFPYGEAVPANIANVEVFAHAPPPPPPPPQNNRPVRRRAPPVPPPVQELAAFAADKQNIHTTQSVNMTKAVVERVLRIPVSADYRWNMDTVSKTVGEIIIDCNLTTIEMVEMMNRYIRDDDVYDMGKGIYGKVLDGVWQYVRNSSDKADLCRILKQELKDNIGMCAQGNLTRLCNVLAGYMDGIGPQESPSERLGRELPLLMEIENVTERLGKAKDLMKSLALPEADWNPWLEALAA